MLYNRYIPPNVSRLAHAKNAPILIFLHGFLGNGSDWKEVLDHLPTYASMTLDLPGHGQSSDVQCTGFSDVCNMISTSIQNTLRIQQLSPQSPIIFVGYSLGARLIMYGLATSQFSHLNIVGTVIEGGNFGLQGEYLRNKRYKNDAHWAGRFKNQPIEQVLADWYQQDVFSSLNDEQRQYLVTKRSVNLGCALAEMLMATSLSKQPNVLQAVQSLAFGQHTKLLYLCGEHDKKFRALAEQSQLHFEVVEGAGHNAHVEQPRLYAQTLNHYIEQTSS